MRWRCRFSQGRGGEQLAAISGISRLLQRVAVDPAEGMPAISENCTTPDAALWRALAAASANDAEGIARNAAGAATMLLQVPEPLIQLMVFRLVDAAGDNLTTLQTLAGALRNTETGQAEDEAGRFLLQARIARLDGDTVEERAFLDQGGGLSAYGGRFERESSSRRARRRTGRQRDRCWLTSPAPTGPNRLANRRRMRSPSIA